MSLVLGEVLISLVVHEPFAVIPLVEGDDDDLPPPRPAILFLFFQLAGTFQDTCDEVFQVELFAHKSVGCYEDRDGVRRGQGGV